MEVLQVRNLSKRYGHLKALDQVTFDINSGEVWGILGPNGSGKTTLLGILLDIIKTNEGAFEWFSKQYNQDYRLHIGALLETPNFYPDLDAIENLRIIQHIKKNHQDDLIELLRLVKLDQRKHSKISTYSLGMKQRLAIASTLIGNPEVLIFDEPTNGLDPEGIVDVRKTLQQIATKGKTIIMASHILDEVEKICSHVVILHRGKLIKTGRVSVILGQQNYFQLKCKNNLYLKSLLEKQPEVTNLKINNDYLEITTSDHLSAEDLNRFAFEQGLVLDHLVCKKNTLEEEFIKLIQPA